MKPALAQHRSGFTLVELLLVLALVALAAGVVAPQLMRWVEGSRQRAALESLRTALSALPEQAFFSGQAIELGRDGKPSPHPAAPVLPVPDGWTLRLSAPLRYEANGMTRGGTLDVIVPDRPPVRWRIDPPTGNVRDEDAAPAR